MATMALSKLEIDVPRIEHLKEAADLAKKHSCYALIVAPDLVTAANMTRAVKQAKFKILTTVDQPRGDLYGKEKFRGLPTEAMNAEGYEILLTPKQTAHEVLAEVRYLSEFCQQYFGIVSEIRFVLDVNQPGRGPEFVANVLNACKLIPLPALIRTTHHTKIAPGQSSIESLTKLLATCRGIRPVTMKISGNIDYNIYSKVPADRFGVSLIQAQAISKEVASIGKPKPAVIAPTAVIPAAADQV